jgi:predicted branched-subunit amino acid permease
MARRAPPRQNRFVNAQTASPSWTGFRAGARMGAGLPALMLGASYVGFGGFVRDNALGLDLALFSTLTAWALPGQLAMVELYLAGAPLLAIALAVALANMRLAPMTTVMLPVVKLDGRPAWRLYAAANWVAITCWALTMLHGPALPREQRLAWFLGCALVLWSASLIGCVAGYFAAGALPGPIALALVFLNPLYFMLLCLQDLKQRPRALAMLLGAVFCAILHPFVPDWSLLIAGLAGGTAGYLVGQRWTA